MMCRLMIEDYKAINMSLALIANCQVHRTVKIMYRHNYVDRNNNNNHVER